MGKYLNNPLGRKVLCRASISGDGWATAGLVGEGEKWGKADKRGTREKPEDGVSQSNARSWNQWDYVTVRTAEQWLSVSPQL